MADGRDHAGVRDTTVASIARYAASGILRQILGVFTALARPMLLSPEHYGLWNLLKTFPQYASYAHLGARSAARYAIPFNQAAGRDDANRTMENTIFWGALGLNLVPALGLVAVAAWGGFSGPERFGLLTVAGLILLYWFYEHWLTLLKAYQHFRIISWGNVILPAANFLGLGLIWAWGVYGLFVSVPLSLLTVTLYFRMRFPVGVERSFSPGLYVDLVRTGLPIMALALVVLLLRTVDRFVVAAMLGNASLGHYGIAVMILGFVMNVPAATREVMEPKLMQALDHAPPAEFMNTYYFKPLYATAFAMPLLLGPVFYLAPPLVEWLLPRYVPGIPATGVIALGGYFLALVYITRGILVARRRQLRAALLGVGACAANLGLSVALVRAGLGIEGVALATSTALGAYFLALHAYLGRLSGPEVAGWGRSGLEVLSPLAVSVLAGPLLRGQLLDWGLGGPGAAAVGLPLYCAANVLAVAVLRRFNPLLSGFTPGDLLRALRSSGKKR